MYPANMPFPLAVELLCAAAGALAVRWWRPGLRLGAVATAVVGMFGGFAFTLLAAHVPGVGEFVGHVENAADSAIRGTGGLTPAILIGVGMSGLLGGALLTLVVAFCRNAAGAGKWRA